MRNCNLTRPLSFLFVAVCLLASRASLRAQETPAVGASEEAADAFLQAIQPYGLNLSGLEPWHLKVTFQTLDAQGKASGSGSYEEFYRSPLSYKRIYISPTFTRTEWRTETGLVATGDQGVLPAIFSTLHEALVKPMLPGQILHREVIESKRVFVTSQESKIDGQDLQCYELNSTNPRMSLPLEGRYCFDSTNVLREFTVGSPMIFGHASASSFVAYQNRMIASEFLLGRSKIDGTPQRVEMAVHLEFIEPMTASDAAELRPSDDAVPVKSSFGLAGVVGGVFSGMPTPGAPADAVAASGAPDQARMPRKVNISGGVAAGLLVKKVTPVYPADALAARVSGTVVLQATISKAGMVENLRVISGPAMLQGAALDAVKDWAYRPYLLNGEPVEVETTINVIFTANSPE